MSNVVPLLCFDRNGVRPFRRNEQQKEANRVIYADVTNVFLLLQPT
jgi:hypothetical protein